MVLSRPKTRRSAAAAGLILAAAGAARADMQTQGFQYPNFNSTTGLTLVGSAFASAGTLSVTTATSANAGAAWRTTSKPFVGLGFDTTFTFRVQDRVGLGADGIAFVIQNEAPNAFGGNGGAMGYATNLIFPGRPGITNSLAIEFDMWDNSPSGQWPEGSDNHVSIQTRGLLPNSPSGAASLGSVDLPFSLDDGALRTVRIAYDQTTLQVFIDDLFDPVLEATVDLSQVLSLDSERAWVGFTAACGGAANAQRHVINSWTFSGKVPSPGTSVLILAGAATLLRRNRFPQTA